MKTKSIIISTVFICLLPICSLMAECITNENQQEEIATMLKNYTQYATSKDEVTGVYELCFNETQYFGKGESKKKNIEIAVLNGHKLKIVGLHFPDPLDPVPLDLTADDKIFVFSGANTTIDGGFFAGNGSGTAIQVNGANVEIKNSSFYNFEKGIVVAENGSVNLGKNAFSLILEKNIYDGAVTSPINKAGKHLNKDDPLKVDYVVGEMDASICSSNVGSVEMYLRPPEIIEPLIKYHNTAKCSAPAFLTEDVTLEYADKHKETLKKDVTCAFKCENLNDTAEKPITFAYTTADGMTNDFAPMPTQKYVDLPTVISVMGPMSLPNTVSETDGNTIIVADNTGNTDTLGEVPGGTGEPKGVTTGGDGGLVNQEAGASGGCSVAGVMEAAQAKACYSFIFALFGLVPIGWRRIEKQF